MNTSTSAQVKAASDQAKDQTGTGHFDESLSTILVFIKPHTYYEQEQKIIRSTKP